MQITTNITRTSSDSTDTYITTLDVIEGRLVEVPDTLSDIDLGAEDMQALLHMFVPNGDVIDLIEFEQDETSQHFKFKTICYLHNH